MVGVRLTANVSLPDTARKATVAAGKLSAPGKMLIGKQLSILHRYVRGYVKAPGIS